MMFEKCTRNRVENQRVSKPALPIYTYTNTVLLSLYIAKIFYYLQSIDTYELILLLFFKNIYLRLCSVGKCNGLIKDSDTPLKTYANHT